MTTPSTLILIMGVSGTGKTTLAKTLSDKLHWTYLEADEFHSEDAVKKMRSGIPLTEEDREPWVERMEQKLMDLSASGDSCILACSGLRHKHRARLANTGFTLTHSFLLEAEFSTLQQRLENRLDHYMPASLLQSQLETLELPLPDEGVTRIESDVKDSESLTSKVLDVISQ